MKKLMIAVKILVVVGSLLFVSGSAFAQQGYVPIGPKPVQQEGPCDYFSAGRCYHIAPECSAERQRLDAARQQFEAVKRTGHLARHNEVDAAHNVYQACAEAFLTKRRAEEARRWSEQQAADQKRREAEIAKRQAEENVRREARSKKLTRKKQSVSMKLIWPKPMRRRVVQILELRQVTPRNNITMMGSNVFQNSNLY
jgi:hypothetical protein